MTVHFPTLSKFDFVAGPAELNNWWQNTYALQNVGFFIFWPCWWYLANGGSWHPSPFSPPSGGGFV